MPVSEEALKKLALEIVHKCRLGDAAEKVAENKILPLLKNITSPTLITPQMNGEPVELDSE